MYDKRCTMYAMRSARVRCTLSRYVQHTHIRSHSLTYGHSRTPPITPHTHTRNKLVCLLRLAPHRACIVRVSHTINDKCTSIDCIDHQLIGLHTLIDKEIILIDRYVIQILIFVVLFYFFLFVDEKCTEVLAVMFFSTFLSLTIFTRMPQSKRNNATKQTKTKKRKKRKNN